MNGDDEVAREVVALDAFLRAEFWKALRAPDTYSTLWEAS